MKRFNWVFFFLLLPLFCWAQAPTQPTTPILDTFDGTEQPLTTNWTGGISAAGNCDKVSGVMVNRNDGEESCYYDISTFGQKQEIYFTLPNAGSHGDDINMRAMLCLQDGLGSATADGYGLRIRKITGASNDEVQLFRMLNGSAGYANIGSASTREFVNGDQYFITVDSTNFGTQVDFQVYLNTGSGWGSPIITHSETSTKLNCSATYFGFIIPDPAHQVDNFGGGNSPRGAPWIPLQAR